MRLIDADKLELDYDWSEYEIDDGQVITNGYQAYSEEQIDNAPTVEAIPKADYENRLKSDLEAILEELDLEVDELASHFADGRIVYRYQLHNLIQQKINVLKGTDNEQTN